MLRYNNFCARSCLCHCPTRRSAPIRGWHKFVTKSAANCPGARANSKPLAATSCKLNIGNPGRFGFSRARAPAPRDRRTSARKRGLLPTSRACVPRARRSPRATRTRLATTYPPNSVFIGNGVSELIDIAPARPAQSRRRSAAAEPGLPVVERRDHPQRRPAALLPLPRRERAPARSRRDRGADHAAHARAGRDQSQQSDRRGVSARAARTRWCAIAARHRLLLLADEIYDEILYDERASSRWRPLAGDVPCLSFGGLSKVHRACG